jgi:hypothetical protein
LVNFSDINSEFNLLNANLVTPVGYQLMLSIAEQYQRAKWGIETRKRVMLRKDHRACARVCQRAAKHTSNADDSTKWRAAVHKNGYFSFAVALWPAGRCRLICNGLPLYRRRWPLSLR